MTQIGQRRSVLSVAETIVKRKPFPRIEQTKVYSSAAANHFDQAVNKPGANVIYMAAPRAPMSRECEQWLTPEREMVCELVERVSMAYHK